MGDLDTIKKGVDKHFKNIPEIPILYEIQKKLHFAELPLSLEEYYQCE